MTLKEADNVGQGGSTGRSRETMERWRSYFEKAGTDIWTVIEQAIIHAATDYPQDFKERRSAIAETLFARSLLQLHSGDNDATRLSGSVLTNATAHMEENEEGTRAEEKVIRSQGEAHPSTYQDAEALTDEMEEETLLLKDLYRVKETIADDDQSESTILDSLQRLEYMQITVQALKTTEIGRQVNGLRKHSSKRVRAIVKRLVKNWKELVDQWAQSVEEATAAAGGSEGGAISEPGNDEQGLPYPPLDEGALLAARTSSLEMSQLLSFMDEEICGQTNSKEEELFNSFEPSIKDNLYYPSRSQSGSILTDSSDCDAKASTSCDWGSRLPEERLSTTRDLHFSGRIERKLEPTSRGSTSYCGNDREQLNHLDGLSLSKSVTGGSGPGRPSNDVVKATVISGSLTARLANDASKLNRNNEPQRPAGLYSSGGDKSSRPSTLNKSSFTDKSHVAQKLEISKRKLYEGYQHAENAKKQRTVQLVDLPDLPKAAQVVRGKANPGIQSKAALSGQLTQPRRYG